jgi:hypothetical protein
MRGFMADIAEYTGQCTEYDDFGTAESAIILFSFELIILGCPLACLSKHWRPLVVYQLVPLGTIGATQYPYWREITTPDCV